MKKVILLLILLIMNIANSKELIDIRVDYDEIRIKKIDSKIDEEIIEIAGLLNGDEVIKEVYVNKIFVSAERYRYINKQKFLFYKRKKELDKKYEVIVDDEIVYYSPDKIQQRFFLYPKGAPISREKGTFEKKIKFASAYFDKEGNRINSESGEYPLVSNVLFTPLFYHLIEAKEILYLMDLKK